jgi:ADP-ribose pyrophosphatase
MREGEKLLPFLEVEQGTAQPQKIFSLRQDRVRSQVTGREAVVDRLLAVDWVNVIAFDEDDRLLLVRQWRFGTMQFSVELPAGGLEPGEDPIVGGLRELEEETGHTPVDPSSVVLLGATRPNSAFMNNRCFTVFVPAARRTTSQRLDPLEEIEVLTMPRAELDAALLQGAERCASGAVPDTRGAMLDNSLIVVALHLWKLKTAAQQQK